MTRLGFITIEILLSLIKDFIFESKDNLVGIVSYENASCNVKVKIYLDSIINIE